MFSEFPSGPQTRSIGKLEMPPLSDIIQKVLTWPSNFDVQVIFHYFADRAIRQYRMHASKEHQKDETPPTEGMGGLRIE